MQHTATKIVVPENTPENRRALNQALRSVRQSAHADPLSHRDDRSRSAVAACEESILRRMAEAMDEGKTTISFPSGWKTN